MTRERRSGAWDEFTGPLWQDEPHAKTDASRLDQLVKEYYENPASFHESWLEPLLAEGLSMDRAYDLVLGGTLLPN